MMDKPRLLIVDDDLTLLTALKLNLKAEYDVHTAHSVSSARTLIAKNEYDIAIVDLCFEGQPEDGVALIDHLSTISPGTFLIVLSGDTEVIRVVSAMRRRLFEFVHKGEGFF